MKSLKSLLAATLLLVAAAASGAGHEVKAGDLTLVGPWSRASAAGQANGAAFMTIRNAGGTDRLVSASAAVANVIELHTNVREGDAMRMRKVEQIDVTGGADTELKPGGLHIMLIGLKAPLKAGDSFPLTLKFEKAGEVKVEVKVQAGHMAGAHK